VGSIGSDLRMEYAAVGADDPSGGANGAISCTGNYPPYGEYSAACRGFYSGAAAGPGAVKGLAEPVEIFELSGARSVRTRLQAVAARGLSKFVGREKEVEELQHSLNQAQDGKGQIVAVVGEPGVGKSRLFHEFFQSYRTHGWLVLQSGSVSYGKSTACFPVIELLREYFKILNRDDQRETRERVTGKLITLDPTLEATRDAFLFLFDVPIGVLERHRPIETSSAHIRRDQTPSATGEPGSTVNLGFRRFALD